MSRIDSLHALGQSLWYDNIQRRLLENGELEKMIRDGDIRGVTSNPSIFNNAIAKSSDYDAALKPMAWAGWKAEDIFWQLAVEDIQAAADLFRPLYDSTHGGDGYVSLEVNPYLANDTVNTVSEARRLWALVDRPNLMVKIPATRAGIPAIQQAIAAGINVNVTLIFSLQRYVEVMDAFLRGLEERVAHGQSIDSIASVASFFVSRIDTKVDGRLEKVIQAEGTAAPQAASLRGKAAIASARLAYAKFQEIFGSDRFVKLKAKGGRTQRPLWASTSTKNPDYRDVIYVEELIAPDTVNTVPPQTLVAFKDHGESAVTIEKDLAGMRKALADLEAMGIHMEQVTDELEEEGVKSFSDAFTGLLKTIDDRRTACLAELGDLQEKIARRVKNLTDIDAARRLWQPDPTLWTEDPAEQKEILQRVGWLRAPEKSRALISQAKRILADCQQEGYTHALLLGMGGSSLAPEVLRLTFGVQSANDKPGLDLAILDSTDPAQVRTAAQRAPLARTLFIVSSKSGSTSETQSHLAFFWKRAVHSLGKVKAGEHFVAITDPGSMLEKQARERSFREVVLADPNVGGRYSALIAFGILPAGLLGLDLDLWLARAGRVMSVSTPATPAGRNPGLVLGAILGEAALAGRDKLTILTDPEFSAFGSWLEQLVAESSGKQGKGIIPVDQETLLPPRNYSKDRLFVYIRLTGSLDEQVKKLHAAGHPALVLPVKDTYDLSAEFYRWEVAIAIACAVLGVDAFNQPDVQDNKTRTQQKIAAFQKSGKLDEGEAIWEGEGGRVYGQEFPGLNGAKTIADVVEAFLQQAKAGVDYVALNAYLPRNPRTASKLQKVRSVLLVRTGCATTLGFGPRFLHSTGQLHKGGGDNGVFIQITRDPTVDFEIPEQGIRFATLERAQALGDLEALRSRGRRAIRIHLTSADILDLI
ncbi:transaldolase [Longilinea arvoryzae]|uniref:Transaldolase n=1 Tax=Longilinea arvoryzae TaxID=360412 RepID=A0A0S7BKW3_9CHLR|nr:bifunctional transaldolase/phosoglucose isomerase [Longilinea arvoryzae]GAP14968.1 transaldolase [Longilinea arvoryzae]